VNVSNCRLVRDSLAPAQHLQISRMRALETGRAMLRRQYRHDAIIDPRGRVVARLPQLAEAPSRAKCKAITGATPYVESGNYPIVLACLRSSRHSRSAVSGSLVELR